MLTSSAARHSSRIAARGRFPSRFQSMKSKTSTRFRDHFRGRLAIACALLLAGLSARARAEQSPREVVQSTSDQVLAILADKGLSKEARRDKVKEIVLQNVDFDTLSRLVLARNWSQFSPQQQQEFEREFQGHLAATYGRRLDDYHNEKVAIVGDRKEPNGDWTVQTKILRGGGSNDILVDYRLRQSNGQWKMIDFIIEQVSLVANFRSQFQEIVSSGGPEHLLQVLRETPANDPLTNLVGASSAFLASVELIRRVAVCDATVLIQGETGTGKELAARAIHYLGSRRDAPFVPINCGAIPESLVENELFGHARGAYTDARESRQGVIAQAEGGTLFLDEVEAMGPRGQVALLRFLEDRQYRPVGGAPCGANVWVVASSNADLAALAAEGRYRQDLLFR